MHRHNRIGMEVQIKSTMIMLMYAMLKLQHNNRLLMMSYIRQTLMR